MHALVVLGSSSPIGSADARTLYAEVDSGALRPAAAVAGFRHLEGTIEEAIARRVAVLEAQARPDTRRFSRSRAGVVAGRRRLRRRGREAGDRPQQRLVAAADAIRTDHAGRVGAFERRDRRLCLGEPSDSGARGSERRRKSQADRRRRSSPGVQPRHCDRVERTPVHHSHQHNGRSDRRCCVRRLPRPGRAPQRSRRHGDGRGTRRRARARGLGASSLLDMDDPRGVAFDDRARGRAPRRPLDIEASA